MMTRSIERLGLAAAALALVAVAAMPTPAGAQQHRRGGNGAGIAAGVIGGLAAGAVLGGALAGARSGGPYDEGYDEGGGIDPADVDRNGCPLVRRPVYDRAGRFLGYGNVPTC